MLFQAPAENESSRREIQVLREPFSRRSVSERNGAALRSATGLHSE
jgi:hypothetical protein